MYKEDGYEYLKRDFPKLDYVKGCAIIPENDLDNPVITAMGYDELANYVFGEDEEEL